MERCLAVSLGEAGYTETWELQRRLHQRVAGCELPGVLLLLEHPHVYTLGRRGKGDDVLASPERLKALGAEVHFIDRGGEATYHGPGQLVGYPIVDLRAWGLSPVRYIQTLEQVIIATLADFGIESDSEDRPTGVWVGRAKVAAIGVRISRGVTMHGFALNANSDLSYFSHIVPCGIPESLVTSISRELGRDVTVDEVVPVLTRRFGECFGVGVEWSSVETLEGTPKSGSGLIGGQVEAG